MVKGNLDKDNLVRDVFDKVASKYDLMNNLMSFGSHKIWKKLLIKVLDIRDGMKIIDMSTGTGDISREIMKKSHNVEIFAVDPNMSMVQEGRKKLTNSGYVKRVNWIIGRGENVPFSDSSMDLYVIVFGLRNVTHIGKTLEEAKRVLKKDGRFVCLEFAPSSMGSFQGLYDFYSFNVLPYIGQVVVGDGAPYRYLAESIRAFPPPEELKSMLEDAKFSDVEYQDWNLVALHQCRVK